MELHKQPPKGYRMLICLAWNKHYLGIHSYVAESEPTNDKMFIMSVPFEDIQKYKLTGELTYRYLYKEARTEGFNLLYTAGLMLIATLIIPQFKKQLKAHPEHCI